MKIPLRSSVIFNIKTDDKHFLFWSIIASLHPREKSRPNRVIIHRQYFNELNIEGTDFTNGFKRSDVHKLEKLNDLSINMLELTFHQDQNRRKHKLSPIESRNYFSDKVNDIIIYENQFVVIETFHVYLAKYDSLFIYRGCLGFYSSQNVSLKHIE